MCDPVLIGDDNWAALGATYTNEKPPYVCYPFCDDYNFNDFDTTDTILPCMIEYHGTAMETLISRFVSLIESPVGNDKELCSVDGLNDDRNNCDSSAKISRLCRANR